MLVRLIISSDDSPVCSLVVILLIVKARPFTNTLSANEYVNKNFNGSIALYLNILVLVLNTLTI